MVSISSDEQVDDVDALLGEMNCFILPGLVAEYEYCCSSISLIMI